MQHCHIASDRLVIGGRAVPFVPSPNCGGRIEPHMIVLHDTAGRLDLGSSVSWLCNPKAGASAHFVVERDGSVTQLVDCDRSAWHAGKSSWRGRQGLNAWSIGIEIVNPGALVRRGDKAVAWFGQSWPLNACQEIETPEHGRAWWLPYTPQQIEAVHGIIRALAGAYPTITEVVGHYHIAPRRKVDPGPQWPMAQSQALVARTAPDTEAVRAAQQRLTELGYWPGSTDGIMGPRTRSAIRSFQEANRLPVTGQIDDATRGAFAAETAKPPVTAGREDATRADVRSVSVTATAASHGQRATEVIGVGVVGSALSDPAPVAAPPGLTDGLSEIGGAITKVETAKGLGGRLASLADWITSPAGLKYAVLLGGLAGIWWFLRHVEWRRWRDHITGRNIGG